MESFISVCAWCHFVKTPCGWLNATKALPLLKIERDLAPEEITHGICPVCAVDWAKLDQKSFEDACQKEACVPA